MKQNMPINHRIKWTDDELNQLLRETNNKININKIADNHKRTVEAIKFKLIRHSIKLIDDNPLTISLKEIQKITNLSKNDLLDGFKKIKYNYIINDNDNNDFNDVMNIIHYININVILIWIIIIFHLVFHF
jgi:hypothetical protein